MSRTVDADFLLNMIDHIAWESMGQKEVSEAVRFFQDRVKTLIKNHSTETRWVKVKDKKPNEGDKVLICERTNTYLVDMLKDGRAVDDNEWYSDITDFDYWMLVELPEED